MQYAQPLVCYVICLIAILTQILHGHESAKVVRTKQKEKLSNYRSYTSRTQNPEGADVPKLLVTHDTTEEDLINYSNLHNSHSPGSEFDRNYGDENYDIYSDDSQYDKSDIGSVNDTNANTTTYQNGTESGNCTRCYIRREDKLMRIEMIKQEILNKLRFTTLPNMTGKRIPKIPPISRVVEQYEMQSDSPYGILPEDEYHNEEEFYGQTERLYTIAQKPPHDVTSNISHVCYFDLPTYATERRVQKALLWIYIRPTKHIQNTITEIFIHKLAPPDKPGKQAMKSLLRHRKEPSHRTSGWHHFDVHNIVHNWIRHPESNIGLIIEAFDHLGNNLVVTPPGQGRDEGYEPMLDMKTLELRKTRLRRSIALQCEENSTEVRCCRYPLMVDFVEFGWDWVIAPTNYKANYCSGECQYRHMDSHPHTTVVQQVPRYTTSPCCSPTKVLPLSMLYFDNDHHIFYTTMPAMTVTRCGCA